jgi:hypothetical protein
VLERVKKVFIGPDACDLPWKLILPPPSQNFRSLSLFPLSSLDEDLSTDEDLAPTGKKRKRDWSPSEDSDYDNNNNNNNNNNDGGNYDEEGQKAFQDCYDLNAEKLVQQVTCHTMLP